MEAHPRVDVATLVQEAVAAGLPRVVVTGGEPTMHDLGPLTEALKAAAPARVVIREAAMAPAPTG